MDYGIISLVLIQLGAVIGCLTAWLRNRAEIDRIKDRAITETVLHSTLESRIAPLLARLAESEAGLLQCEQVASKSAIESARALKIASQTDDFDRRITSVQNSVSALKRHRAPKEEPDFVSEIETEPINGHNPEFTPPPPRLGGRDLSTFGKSA